MKISLEELKARSKNAVYYPDLVRIAKEAKSPTAAFEIADRIKANVGIYAKECRFLAMIKRDYGKKIFEQVVIDLTKEAHKKTDYIYLKPFIQTANRINYLYEKQAFPQNDNEYISPDHDLDYADVVKGMLEHFEKMDHDQKQTMINAIGNNDAAFVYLSEAENFVRDVQTKRAIDYYCLQKTAMVLNAYIFAIGKKLNILDIIEDSPAADWVHSYSNSRKYIKEKEKVEV